VKTTAAVLDVALMVILALALETVMFEITFPPRENVPGVTNVDDNERVGVVVLPSELI